MRLRPSFALVLGTAWFTAACKHSETLPPLTTTGEYPPVRSDDPVRSELRAAHVDCERTREALLDDIRDARHRRSIISGAAAVAYVLGELADEDAGFQPQRRECQPGQELSLSPECQVVPSRQAGRGSPSTESVHTLEIDGRSHVRAINRAIEAADDFLFSHPDAAQWSDDDAAEWDRRLRTLQELCAPPA